MSDALTLLRTPTGELFFDAVFKVDHSASLTVTEHPVQKGGNIADHAYMEPVEIGLEIGMSDTEGDDGRSTQMFQVLLALMEQREPVELVTRRRTYPDMLITSLSAPDDYKTMHTLKASLILTQIRTVEVQTVQVQQTVSASKGGAGSGYGGGSSAQAQNQYAAKNSVLAQVARKKKNGLVDLSFMGEDAINAAYGRTKTAPETKTTKNTITVAGGVLDKANRLTKIVLER